MPIRRDMAGRYPADWARRSRFVREYRAQNRCEWCGAANGQPHPVTGSRVVLTVAHVWDKRPEAANLLNLAALCQRCHLRWDRWQHRETRRSRKAQAEWWEWEPVAPAEPPRGADGQAGAGNTGGERESSS